MGMAGSLITLLALPISKKSSDKFLGVRLRYPSDTLGGDALCLDGVTTLGGCDAFSNSITLAGCFLHIFCNCPCLISMLDWGSEHWLKFGWWAFVFKFLDRRLL
jgi:hypothetical protein